MEEQKAIDPAQTQSFTDSLVFWQWKIDPDSSQEKDPAKWTWKDYSYHDSLTIEKAFNLNNETIDIHWCQLDLKKMVHISKELRNGIHRVRRRQEKSRFMIEMPEPRIFIPEQKTTNEAFNSLENFIKEIMKKTPEAYELYQRLEKLPTDCNQKEFEDIIEQVIVWVERGAEARDSLNEAKKIVDFIKDNSTTTLKDFLNAILKIYLLETSFICHWLNELLRNEDWEEIHVIIPYLVCLVYAFKLSDSPIPPKTGLFHSLGTFISKPKLTLYRGTLLTKEHLELYNPEKVKHFSWNGVISASRKKDIALNFPYISLSRPEGPTIAFLFIIETSLASSITDISRDSQYPDEQEVLLLPGTVFKLLKTRLTGNNFFDFYEVTVKVIKKFKKTKEKIPALGDAIQNETAIIDELPSEETLRLLNLLKGNKLIKNLRIRNSVIEGHVMEEIENIRITTNLQKSDITLLNNILIVSSLGVIAHYFSSQNLNEIYKRNQIQFKHGMTAWNSFKKSFEEVRNLTLEGETLAKFQSKIFWENMKNASQITELNLSLKNSEISNDQLRDIIGCIKEFKCLENLKLIFPQDQVFYLEALWETIGSSNPSLKRLVIEPIYSDQELNFAGNAFSRLTFLQHLSLKAKEVNNLISEHGLINLFKGLSSLTSLRHLSLDLDCCFYISDAVLSHFKTALESLQYLQQLSLRFKSCYMISDEGLDHIKTGLLSCNLLEELSLYFRGCYYITDEGLNNFKGGILTLTSLIDLYLNFEGCDKISEDGIKNFKRGLESLKSLQIMIDKK